MLLPAAFVTMEISEKRAGVGCKGYSQADAVWAGVVQGQVWVRLVVVGQSFMLHQIRKMVGLVVAVMRGAASPDAISLALNPARELNVPMAPELGLFLDECFYDAYNAKWGNERETIGLDPYRGEVATFKVRHRCAGGRGDFDDLKCTALLCRITR